jgi:hypothetical protein
MDYPNPEDFNKLDTDKQKEIFMKIFIESNGEEFTQKYYDWSSHNYEEGNFYKIDRKFKRSYCEMEEYEMESLILTYENNKLVIKKDSYEQNYKTIYYTNKQFCTYCGKDALCFGYGDKSYVYMCLSGECFGKSEKEFFHRHGRQYLQDYNYGY